MRWQKARSSDNVVRDGAGGGRRLAGGAGLGGVALVLVLGLLFGKNPGELLQLLDGMQGEAPGGPELAAAGDDEQTEFVRRVLGSTEDVWQGMFSAAGGGYAAPRLVLFSGAVRSACGAASSAMGPFYCPGDRQIYLDLDFFHEMQQRFQAAGEFARAYVIAHEVGHHVQNLTGVMQQVRSGREHGLAMQGATGLSVRQELQADCYAGVWANRAQRQLDWLEAGDLEAALNAASRIGDDALQKQAQGYVVPDSFTHGSSAERVRWFKAGFERGDVGSCDTFSAKSL